MVNADSIHKFKTLTTCVYVRNYEKIGPNALKQW